MMALEADRLSFSYGEVPVLLLRLLWAAPGGFAALIGPNGAGKSTLLKLLLGELSPSQRRRAAAGPGYGPVSKLEKAGLCAPGRLARHTDFPASVEEVVLANLSGEIGLFRFPRQEHRSGCGRPWNWWEWPAMGAG